MSVFMHPLLPSFILPLYFDDLEVTIKEPLWKRLRAGNYDRRLQGFLAGLLERARRKAKDKARSGTSEVWLL